jgi:hypothetical protein
MATFWAGNLKIIRARLPSLGNILPNDTANEEDNLEGEAKERV